MCEMRLNIVEDSKSTSGGVLVHFWKSHTCTDQLDVQEANVSVSQLHRIRDHIVGCWFADGCLPALDLLDLVIEVLGMNHRIPKRAHGKPV